MRRKLFLAGLAGLLLLVVTPAAAQAGDGVGFTGRMSGSWWDPARGGEGQFISFERVGGRRVVMLAWFTYDDEGNPRWLVGSADYGAGAGSIEIPLLSGRGARFGVGFEPGDVVLEDAGTVQLSHLACDRLGFDYQGEGDEITLELERLVGPLNGAGCAGDPEGPAAARLVGPLTGSWWHPERGGEGQFVAFETVADRLVASLYYFTYDAEGRPTWLVGSSDYGADQQRVEIEVSTGSGARFGSAFDSQDVEIRPGGRVILRLADCDRLRLRYNGSKTFGLDLERLVGALDSHPCELATAAATAEDEALRELIDEHGLTGDPGRGRDLPGIDAPLARLGKLLFFSKALSVDGDAACASCHHPVLGGGDGLAVSVGTGAEHPDLLGPGRKMPDGSVIMHRNANTIFNSALLDRGLFWDSRVERLPGPDGGIRTPDTPLGAADPLAGSTLLAAQARFPVVAPAEMRGTGLPGLSDEAIRGYLAERLGDYGEGAGALAPSQWLARFRLAFDSPAGAEDLISFANISRALAAYQRSAIFVESPWAAYVRGDNGAIDAEAKVGALRFFRSRDDGGMHCVRCHSGDLFTNQAHRRAGFPQVGPGFGDGNAGDFGRARETGLESDRHAFRVPGLLNVELTAPYGHAGNYADLNNVAAHYVNTVGTARGQILTTGWCQRPPFNTQPDCAEAKQRALDNTNDALDSMQAARLTDPENAVPQVPVGGDTGVVLQQLAAFLRTLTDPCLADARCYERWIPAPEEAPDDFQLNAVFGEDG